MNESGSNPWVGKIPQSKKQQPTPAFLPGKFHGQRNLEGYSPRVSKSQNDWAHTHTQWLWERKWKIVFHLEEQGMPLREAGSFVGWDTERPSPAHLWFPGRISSTISSPRRCSNQRESLNDLFMETSLKLCSGFPSVVKLGIVEWETWEKAGIYF